jgi:hypothetical protein
MKDVEEEKILKMGVQPLRKIQLNGMEIDIIALGAT